MENPYQPPRSDVAPAGAAAPRKRFWKFMFWLHLVFFTPLVILGVAAMIFEGTDLTAFDFLDLLCFPVIVLGLYGYAYNKRLLTQRLWQIAAFAYPAWVVLYELALPFLFDMPVYGEPRALDATVAVSLFFSGVAIAAFYLYARRSPAIWERRPEGGAEPA